MKYEKTNDANFLGKWRYQVQVACYFDWTQNPKGSVENWKSKDDETQIRLLESYLGRNAHAAWSRKGNNFYFIALDDVFKIRLYFDDVVRFVREAGSFPKSRLDESPT